MDVRPLPFTAEKYEVAAVVMGEGFSWYSSYLRTEPDRLAVGLGCDEYEVRGRSHHSDETRFATFMVMSAPKSVNDYIEGLV
jgi:hypothetical protein